MSETQEKARAGSSMRETQERHGSEESVRELGKQFAESRRDSSRKARWKIVAQFAEFARNDRVFVMSGADSIAPRWGPACWAPTRMRIGPCYGKEEDPRKGTGLKTRY